MICTFANGLWMSACLPNAWKFARATRRVRDTQMDVLHGIVDANRDTEFGRRHRFGAITTPREFQRSVPVRSYEDYERDVRRIAAGAQRVLTAEPVRLLEPTSGSTSATKLIPYTRALQRQFQRGIAPWVVDLFTRHPDVMHGQAYWSVSPALGSTSRTDGGVPVGFEDDSAYVGGWRRRLVRSVMAVPASVRHAPGVAAFRYHTLLALVRSGNLRLISVWNPSFLSLIVGSLPAHADALLSDLRDCPRRARALRSALVASTLADRHVILWPRLQVLSCWADGNAAGPARALAALFPHAAMQPKGLIATEGFVSFPLAGREGSALAVRSHFLEFAGLDSEGAPDEASLALAHELEPGRRYAVVITTGGGLYRYRLHDIVEVIGQVRECPLVRFIGKHEYVSDWFGEKLHESHVASVLSATVHRPAFAMLACDNTLSPPSYVAYLESECDDATLIGAAAAIDDGLRQNIHYDYARLLGQLGPVRAFRVERGGQTYVATRVSDGQRAGAVKALALDRRDGWSRRFHGRFIPTPSRSTPSGSVPSRLVR
jgi:hypothetical protein